MDGDCQLLRRIQDAEEGLRRDGDASDTTPLASLAQNSADWDQLSCDDFDACAQAWQSLVCLAIQTGQEAFEALLEAKAAPAWLLLLSVSHSFRDASCKGGVARCLAPLVGSATLREAFRGAEETRVRRLSELKLCRSYVGDSPRANAWAEATVHALDSLPKRVSRGLGAGAPVWTGHDVFWRAMAEAWCRFAEADADLIVSGGDFLAVLVLRKLCVRSRAALLASSMVGSATRSAACVRILACCLPRLSDAEVRSTLTALLGSRLALGRLVDLFRMGKDGELDDVADQVTSPQFVKHLSRKRSLERFLFLLLDLQSDENGAEGSDLLLRLVLGVAAQWTSARTVNVSLTRTLIFALQHLSRDEIEIPGRHIDQSLGGQPGKMSVLLHLLRGVNKHLEAADGESRLHAMLVAKGLADAVGEGQLHFDELDAGRNRQAADELRIFVRDAEDGNGETEGREEDHAVIEERDPGGQDVPLPNRVAKERNDQMSRSDVDSDDWSDDEFYRDTAETVSRVREDEQSDDEGGGTIEARVPKPYYCRDLIVLLRKQESDDAYESHGAVLDYAEDLIRRKPPDLLDLIPQLLKDFLCWENRFALQDFESRKQKIVLALAASAPEITGQILAQQVVHGSQGTGGRLYVLQLIRTTALTLASRPSDAERGKKALLDASTAADSEGKSKEAKEPCMKENRTRIWGKAALARRRKAEGKPFGKEVWTNQFMPHASLFFHTLKGLVLKSFSDNSDSFLSDSSRLWNHADGPVVLSQVLLTLGTILEACAPGPDTPRLAQELVEIAWSWHRSDHTLMRRATVLAAMTALQQLNSFERISPSKIDTFRGVGRWLLEAAKRDGDDYVRRAANAALQQASWMLMIAD